MSTAPLPPPGPSVGRRVTAWVVNLVLLVFGGAIFLFVAFLFAYGFSESTIEPAQHVFFLILVAVSAVVGGIVVGLIDLAILGVKLRTALTFGVLTSFAAHLVALGGGTLVSLANEDQNSITTDLPNAPFVALVIVSFVLALVAVVGALRVSRPVA